KVLMASDYLVSGESFDIMECNDCSLRFTSPIPDSKEIVNYYKSDKYISHAKRVTSVFDIIYKIVRKFTLRSKRKIVKQISQKQSGMLLDIGCGTGEFLKTMKQSDWDIAGVEVNEKTRRIAQTNADSIILDTNDFFKNKQKYDVITLWHSLEHLNTLARFLNKISLSLNSNGVIMVAVPNYRSFDAEYYKQDWAAYDVPRHLYHFSFEAMVKLMEKFKFRLIQSKQLPFDPFYVSLLSEFSVRKKHNIIKALWIGWKSYWQGRKDAERGSSILYIFKSSQ
ncbi:MAG: methyltransferase domain-containing protein, partial [Planctomycetia bacterium]|nr:methyltransferase domain-containing protein [Planctomycetia bacterium]